MSPRTSVPGGPVSAHAATATEPLWTVDEVAAYLRLKPETVRTMAREKSIPGFKIGKAWRFSARQIKSAVNLQLQSQNREGTKQGR